MLLFLLTMSVEAAYPETGESTLKVSVVQQGTTCKGVVKDAAGETIIGASVVAKGTTNGTITGINGDFSLNNVKTGDIIVVSFVGYQTQEIKFTGQSLNIILKDNTQTLDEVVVVAFGTQKKVNVTGSVSTVGAKEISARPVNSTIEALQGMVPGMNISTGDGGGSLGSDKKFNIRGVGTIGAGSKVEPLVLIDGMEGDMNAINPQDIENISVLKDAAASSIYGSRAPGGVILITTKKGKSGKTVVNYNNNFRFVSPLNMPEMADSYNFALAVNDQLTNGGQTPMYSATKLQQILDFQAGKSTQYMWPTDAGRWNSFDDPQRQDVMPTGNTDWLKTLFGNSFTHEHSLSVNGGTDKIQYYLSANYLDQGGLLKFGDDNKQRYSFTAKINADLTKWLKISYSMRFNRTDYEAPSFAGGDIKSNVFYFDVCRYWPVIPVVDPNGFYTVESKIYQLTEGGRYKSQKDVMAHQLAFIVEPIKDWKINVELNYRSNYNFNHTDYQTVYGYDVSKNPYIIANQTSSVTEYAYKSNFFNPNIFTEYGKSLESGHNFKVMLGFQSELFKQRDITASQDGIMSEVATLNTTQTNAQNRGGYSEWATAGFFGRVNYDWKERYLFTFSLRHEGSSRFGENHKWGNFPAVSVGWRISDEKFMKGLSWIDDLKVRYDYGVTGNQEIGNYNSLATYRAFGWYQYNGNRFHVWGPSKNTNSELRWEKGHNQNVGLDFSLFSHKVNGSFNYFHRKQSDLLGDYSVPVPPNLFSTIYTNVGTLRNTGFELDVTVNAVRTKDFTYSFTLVGATNNNKFVSFSNDIYKGQKYYSTCSMANPNNPGYLQRIEEGERIGNYFTYRYAGVDKKGDWLIYDKKGNVIPVAQGTEEDKSVTGNGLPKFTGSMTHNFTYKNFDLSVALRGAAGFDIFNVHDFYFGLQSMTTNQLTTAYSKNAHITTGKNVITDYFIEPGDYLKIDNVTLGYTMNLNKKYIEKIRLFGTANNLYTFTKFTGVDPSTYEVNGLTPGTFGGGYNYYPSAFQFILGLQVSF